jgi:hypothetical protein
MVSTYWGLGCVGGKFLASRTYGSEFDFLLDLCADFHIQMKLLPLQNTVLFDCEEFQASP